MRLFFLYVLTCLILISCKVDSTKTDKSLASLDVDFTDLNSEVLSCDSMIASHMITVIFDGYFITRSLSDFFFTVYKLNDDGKQVHEIGSFAKQGNGPYEFFGVPELQYDQNERCLNVVDLQGGMPVSVYKIDISNINNIFNPLKWIILPVPKIENATFASFKSITDSSFISLGGQYETVNLVSLINSGDKINQDLKLDYPEDGIDAPPVVKRGLYNHGELLLHPQEKKMIYYCTNWGNYAEIIDYNDEMTFTRNLLTDAYPIYTIAKDGLNAQSEARTLMGMEAYVTKEYIYLLPNLNTKDEYLEKRSSKDYSASYKDKIYLFNWDGEFQKAIHLNDPVRKFVVSEDDKYLIGSSIDIESGDIIFRKYNM